MAISAVSAIPTVGLFRPSPLGIVESGRPIASFGASSDADTLGPVRSAGRPDADPEEPDEARKAKAVQLPGADPRGPAWIAAGLEGRGAAQAGQTEPGAGPSQGSPSARARATANEAGVERRDPRTGLGSEELRRRLEELQGQKASEERRRSEGQSSQSQETLRVVEELQARDGQVRAHEAAHVAAGGRYITGGISYVFERGPDGREYAVGGEVGIDSSPIPGKPEETVAKMQIVRAAALAPADPSAADLAIAAQAAQVESEALAEVASARAEAAAKSYGDRPPQNSVDMVA